MKFGQLYFTKQITQAIDKNITFSRFIVKSLEKYGMNDWGNICDEDKEVNDLAIQKKHGRVIAKYNYKRNIYIITDIQENQRHTTVMFCDEY